MSTKKLSTKTRATACGTGSKTKPETVRALSEMVTAAAAANATSKEGPLLFSGSMVRALLAERKTKTRRVVKGTALDWLSPGKFTPEFVANPENYLCPYGYPGDRLWVRETFYAFGKYIFTGGQTATGKPEMAFLDLTAKMREGIYLYAATEKVTVATSKTRLGWHRRPSIFMPRVACRLTLKITAVRVERLHQITVEDVAAEGFSGIPDRPSIDQHFPSEKLALFGQGWDSINSKRAGCSWADNPWVWVISFKVDERS